MTVTSATPSPAATRFTWRRAEFILFGLAILSLVSLLISVRTVWGNLPAHPLFVHVPVIMIPLAVLGALALTARPRWFDRYGVLVCVCAIIGMSSVFLAENAGGQLQSALHLTGQAAHLINEHSAAANVLAILFAGFTLFLLIDFTSHRITAGRPLGVGSVDGVLGNPRAQLLLRTIVVVLALVCAFYVYRVGDLGARAVWQGQIQSAGH